MDDGQYALHWFDGDVAPRVVDVVREADGEGN